MARRRHGPGGPGGFRRGPARSAGRRNAARFGGRGIFGPTPPVRPSAGPHSPPTAEGASADTPQIAVVDSERCTGCGACAVVCPREAITITDSAHIAPELCTGCGACVARCPQDAIRMTSRPPADN